MMNIASNAYQVNDFLLAGNQSDKLSSDHSVNILAQQPPKVLGDVSAKIHANQSSKITENQSGEYFSGYKFADILRYSNLSHSKRGEFTPFAKGDLSHLIQGLIVVTTRGGIEFCESIKSKIIEFCLSIKKERIEFLESIKKDSFVKCAIHHLRLLLTIGYSVLALAKSSVRIETLNLLKVTHDAPCVFFCVYAYAHLQFAVLYRTNSMVMLAGQPKGWLVSFSTSSLNPVSVTTPIEIETSGGDSLDKLKEIIVMMATPTQTQFKFLFLAVKRTDKTDTPHRIEATASNEHDARLMLVRDYILSFAGRLPTQEVAA